jgi:hypothetical protein
MQVNIMRMFVIAFVFIIGIALHAQVELNRIGQTPGGSANHVNYDSLSKRLYVGAGTSLWVYDMTNPLNPRVIAKRPFTGMINETILKDNILFVAATHDGIYAVDINSDTLKILAQADISGLGDIGAYDISLSGDILYVADKFKVRRFRYKTGTGFESIDDFAPLGAFCVTIKNGLVAVGKQAILGPGKVEIYNQNNLSAPLASWSDSRIQNVQNLKFSDLHDNILFVCGGPTEFFTKSYLFALELNGNKLNLLDTFSVSGIPLLAQANITGIDSRNDTLYLATTCAVDKNMGLPLAYIPIIDATKLPTGKMKMIDYVNPGLWHFDVSLMRGTPYLATASEWYGVVMNNITTSNPLDTLPMVATGGWTQKSKIKDDILWVAHEGWGLAAYKVDSILFKNGYNTNSIILHLFKPIDGHYFVGDFCFPDDTLLVLSDGQVYNLKPWKNGGQPDSLYTLKCSGNLNVAYTNAGRRLIVGRELLNAKEMTIFNPYNPGGYSLKKIRINNNTKGITVNGDTVFYGSSSGVPGGKVFLVAARVVNDNFIALDSIETTTNVEINSIDYDKGIVAISKGGVIEWYRWQNGKLTLSGKENTFMNIADISLKNNYLYVADKFSGVKVFDISKAIAKLVAQYKKLSGWSSNFGYQDICIADDGKIYLSDFNAGVIVIQAFDTSLTSVPAILREQADKNMIYPNPAGNYINIILSEVKEPVHSVKIYDILGVCILTHPLAPSREVETIRIDVSGLPAGVYFIRVGNISFNFIKL